MALKQIEAAEIPLVAGCLVEPANYQWLELNCRLIGAAAELPNVIDGRVYDRLWYDLLAEEYL